MNKPLLNTPALSRENGAGEVASPLGLPTNPVIWRDRDTLIRNWQRWRLQISFSVFVALPTLLTAIYLIFVATPEYVADARFTVRAAEPPLALAQGLMPTIGVSALGLSRNATQDAYIVSNYIKGRTVIQDLGGPEKVHEIYSRRSVDWLSRLEKDATAEEIWKYWQKKVGVVVDTQSGIISLGARAFHPEDAQRLVKNLIALSENLINNISDRIRRNAMERARSELELAQERLRSASLALLAYQNQSKTINPLFTATSAEEAIAKLLGEKLKLENDLAVLNARAADSPGRNVLTVRLQNIDAQINELREQLASQTKNQNSPLSSQIAHFEDLKLQLQFAEGLYKVTQAAYDKARSEQDRQELYLVVIVPPSLPEKALYPQRFSTTALVLLTAFVFWSIATLIIAAVRDHIG